MVERDRSNTGVARGDRVRRFRVDRSVERFGDVVLGGSPLRLMRFGTTANELLNKFWHTATCSDARDADENAREANQAEEEGNDTILTSTYPADGDDQANLAPVIDRLVGAGMLHPIPERRRVNTDPSRFAEDSDGDGQIDVTIVTPALACHGGTVRALPDSVVVDDGSEPPIATAHVRLATNLGPAAARNAGLATITTELVAFVDTEVTVDDDWLDLLVGHFDDPAVVLVAPRVCTAAEAPAPTATRLARYEYRHSPLDLGEQAALVAPGARVGYVPGTAVVCRAEAVRQIGGFDPGLRYGEDVDLVWRLVTAGFQCRYEPLVVVTHPARPNWSAWWRQRVSYGTSAAPLAERHGAAVAPARLNRWSLAAWLIALGGPISWVIALAVAFTSAAALPRRIPALPPKRALRLALLGTWKAGDQLATAVRRGWWPFLLVTATGSRRARRALLVSVIAARNPIRVADDIAYSVGVWKGVWAQRSLRAMTPIVT